MADQVRDPLEAGLAFLLGVSRLGPERQRPIEVERRFGIEQSNRGTGQIGDLRPYALGTPRWRLTRPLWGQGEKALRKT